jgi:hypothetical protein
LLSTFSQTAISEKNPWATMSKISETNICCIKEEVWQIHASIVTHSSQLLQQITYPYLYLHRIKPFNILSEPNKAKTRITAEKKHIDQNILKNCMKDWRKQIDDKSSIGGDLEKKIKNKSWDDGEETPK